MTFVRSYENRLNTHLESHGKTTDEVHVLEIRLLPEGRPLRAYVDIEVGDWKIYDFRIAKRDGERAQVIVPQTSWRAPDGKIRYRSLLSIPGELRQRIEVAILSTWEMEIKNEYPKNP